ncbi:integron-associated HEPN domain-containing protein [Shewanella sp. OMA3-2]|uniref:integron-associated HEPN domain-containing protein n=1 Tax=Shewanella sp. OMA3-2 TaxID=2908650 RepID=UPI001F2EADD3|nr:integron-associated HEPN domain-containing protein [Shewanella sp. OMA3-2]UJF21202.1 hypothetical protein L0B17_13810 [Shewanella sp. OMA3-2]
MSTEISRAINILNHLVADLTMAITVLKDYEKRGILNSFQRQNLYRLCFTSLIMNCSKYEEFCNKYRKVIYQEVPHLKELSDEFKKTILAKGIKSYRNDYIGHIHSKKLQRPLTDAEVQSNFVGIIGSDNALDFFDWICPDNYIETDKTTHLVGVIETLRDDLSNKL